MSKYSPLQGLRKLFNRRVFIALLIVAQLILAFIMLYRMIWLKALLSLFSVLTALHLLLRTDKSAFKLSLVFLILLFPVFGGAFYWIFHSQTASVGFRRRLSRLEKETAHHFCGSDKVFETACQALPEARKQLFYLKNNTPFPVYGNTETNYFASGAEMLPALLQDLKNAKHYIFLEYFIIESGQMWDSILQVLQERVKAGVAVRVIYDDIGCLLTLPPNYAKTLREMGIQAEPFNRFHPFLTNLQNNRDHRKIAVIDGLVAYTGGINLADEYIGKKIKYGKWKDAAVRLCGDGAWSFTLIFLQTWSLLSKTTEDYLGFRPTPDPSRSHVTSNRGWVQPYSDSPMGKENVGEHVYLRIIESAQHHLYITTPYLMVDDSMLTALKTAAKCGVDVRMILPEQPDKPMVHFTSRSYYHTLIRAGVKIYEYKGGFMHAKLFLADDRVASVGTVNLDYRSLYLHFECGVCLYRTSAIAAIADDFQQTLTICKEITEKDCKAGPIKQFWQSVCRIFAPLM